MAFGQPSGPPATARQLNELLALLQAAGHDDFRDARGPMSFTQRQGGGKFTREEADEFIRQLQDAADEHAGEHASSGSPPDEAPARAPATTSSASSPGARAPAAAPRTPAERTLRAIPTDRLAAELQRRGWIVVEP